MHIRTHVDIIIFAIDKGFNGIGKEIASQKCIYAFLFIRLGIRKPDQTCPYLD